MKKTEVYLKYKQMKLLYSWKDSHNAISTNFIHYFLTGQISY